MITYLYDCYSILNKVYSDKTFFKQAIISTVIEEKNRALTIKTCYGVLDKDIELSYYISSFCDKQPKLAIRTILKISMYAIKYLGKHGYAVTKNAVELVKKLGKSGASGFVNAFLRKFLSQEISFPIDEKERLSIKYSYPYFAVNELVKYYGYDRTERIISSENKKTTLCFYNTNGEDYLKDNNVKYEITPFENVFSTENFVRNEDYDKGLYTYQSLGSVAICESIEPCDNLLDCCAAPGGKSVRLSYKCKNITSWDIHPHRVELINDYSSRMGRLNISASVKDSKEFDISFEEKFDAVLCDAPCSGFGVISDNPDIKLNRTEEDIKSLNNEQFSILNNVSKYIKVGGYLYYSTCSVLPKENIEIINKFLSCNKGFEIIPLDSKLPHEKVNGTISFLPDISGGLGFYLAKLKRVR